VSSVTKTEFNRLGESLKLLEKVSAILELDVQYLQNDGKDAKQVLEKFREQIATLQTQNAVLNAAFEDFKKRWDESDRRRWTVYGVMIAAGLAFVANLILLFLRR